MKCTEQLFDGIFEPFLEKAKEGYLNGKITARDIFHFAKTFAVEFYNQKTKHFDFEQIEENYHNGRIDALQEVLDSLTTQEIEVKKEINRQKRFTRPTQRQIMALEAMVKQIEASKEAVQSKIDLEENAKSSRKFFNDNPLKIKS